MPKPKIFISYSSKDRTQAETIHKSLEAAGFDVWRDQTRLETDWSREIAFALAGSDLLCLLWSDNSATSKWVKHEWLTARALEKRIIPCLFPKAPDLPEPLHNVHGVSFASIDEGCVTLIKRISETESFYEEYDYTILPRNSYIPFNPNPHFTGRHIDLLELYFKMIGNLNKIGINQVGTVGMGGIGKTQLAVEFALRFSFGFHAVYWIQAANYDTWITEFVSIARDRLRREIKDFDKLEGDKQYLFALQEYFKDHPNTLVIMDNVTEPKLLNNDAYFFGLTPLTLGCELLFTTRLHFQLPGVFSQAVNVFSPEAAYHLLASYRKPKPEEEAHAQAICNAVGFLPLAITLASTNLAKYSTDISFADYHDELLKKRLDVIDIGEMSEEDLATRHVAAVKATLEDHWRMLKDKNARYLFRLAGQFPEAAIIPKARLGLLAGIQPGKSKIDQPLAKAFNNLHDLCLVERLEGDASAARLHPLVRAFSNQLVSDEEQAKFKATAARRLRDALFEYTRLETEVQSRGVEEVIEGLETGLDWWDNDGESLEELKLLQGALRLSSHVLTQDSSQLAAQLLGRLLEEESQGIEALLEGARKSKLGPWLRPLQASLTQPGGPLIRTLAGHTDQVRTVAVTPDGRRAVSGSLDATMKVWDLETGKEIMSLKGHGAGVEAVAVTPNGRWAVSGSRDRTLKVWDLVTGKEIVSLEGHADIVNAVAVTPDGRWAVSGAEDKALKVWDLETGKEIKKLEGHNHWVVSVAVLPDGRRAISGSMDETMKLWNLETGKEILSFSGCSGWVTSVAVTPDGRQAVSASGKTPKVWDLETGKKTMSLEGHTHQVYAVAVTPDGWRAITGSVLGTLKVWELTTGKEVKSFRAHSKVVTSVAVLPDSKRAVSGSYDNTLKLFNLEIGKKIRSRQERYQWISSVVVTLDGTRAVSGSWDSTLRVWDLKTGKEVMCLQGHDDGVTSVAITADGKRVVSGSFDKTLKIWDLESGKEVMCLQGHTDSINVVVVTPDGTRAVSVSDDNKLKVWDLKTGKEIVCLHGHFAKVDAVAMTSDGTKVVSGSWDSTLRIWDSKTGKEISCHWWISNMVNAVAVTPDGKLAVSGSNDSMLRVWDLENGKEILCLQGHADSINVVEVTSDGRWAVSGSEDKNLKVWALETGREILSLVGHADSINVLAVTPDSKRVVAGSRDNHVILWDLELGVPIGGFWGDSGITACAITPDGKTIVAGEASGRIHFLKVEGDEE